MKTILIIDDATEVRELLAEVLREHGHQVFSAADSHSAMKAIASNRPDLVLLEVAMADMIGFELLQSMRSCAQTACLPVVALTKAATREAVIRAGKLGVRGYLLKNHLSVKELLRHIDGWLGLADAPAAPAPVIVGMDVNAQVPPAPAAPLAPPAPASAADSAAPLSADSAPPAPPAFIVPHFIPNEDPADTLKRLKPIITRTEIQDRIDRCGDLKALSPTVTQVLKLTRSPNCSIDQLARLIRQDQAISLRVLKLANSSVYSRSEPVESLPKAITRIGINQIQQTVLNLSVIDSFSKPVDNEHLDTCQFWEHSIACALIAAHLTQARGGTDEQVDTAFTTGLLHDVGRLVYAQTLGATYDHAISTANQLHLPLERVESRLLLINHADAMERIFRQWRLPAHLATSIASHHEPISSAKGLPPENITELATLALANRLAHAMMLGSSGNQVIYPLDEFLDALELDAEMVAEIETQIPEQTDDIKFTMLSNANQTTWPQAAEQVRAQLQQPFRPLFISNRPSRDALRMFCDRIKETQKDQPPNVIIVRLAYPRERVPLTTRLLEAEAAAGVSGLPLVLISPRADVLLEERAMADRPFRSLPEPTPIPQFIQALNELLHEHSPAVAA